MSWDTITLNRQEELALEEWFEKNDYEILNLQGLVKYLCENYYIRDTRDVVDRNLELREAENVPWEWLDFETIVHQDDDFIELGPNRHMNIYEISEDTYEYEHGGDHELFKYVQLKDGDD